MQNFADQCLDLAKSILEHNLEFIQEDGTLLPVAGEDALLEEPGHVAFAIGEYYRATDALSLGRFDLVDLAARCITAQVFSPEAQENGLAYAALGLLSFGPSKDRNPVWERLMDPTRERFMQRLVERKDHADFQQVFNIAKSVARYSFGFSKKDDTGKLIDQLLEKLKTTSVSGFYDNGTPEASGSYDIQGILAFVLVRQSLQLHADAQLKERKLPAIRTYAEKYLRLLGDLVRSDGMGWAYGSGIGAYGQMYSISLILQGMRDNWFSPEHIPVYQDLLRRLFLFFFSTYVDQEHGYLVIRDAERTDSAHHSTRMANFDASRYLCQWSRLAKSIDRSMGALKPFSGKTMGRYISFQKTHKKEQGLFVYQDAASGLHVQIPLIASTSAHITDYLPFPHAPGIFDWPTSQYVPAYLPELTFGDKVCLPAFYGKDCTSGIGLKNAFYFKYEQPDLITKDQIPVPGLGSCKVHWSFLGNKITSEFVFTVKNTVQLDSFRYVIPLGSLHSAYRSPNTFCLGEESLRPQILKDDFQATWAEPLCTSEDPAYRSYYGKIHYLQILERKHPLIMRPGQQYRLSILLEPDITLV
jgi:hypothetical protein